MHHWFGNDKKLCVQEIFHRFKNGIIAPLFGDNLWSHPFHAKTKTIAIDAYFIFYKRHYWHKIIVYKRQNIQKEFCCIIAKTKCAKSENETSKTSLFSLPFFSLLSDCLKTN